MKDIDITDNKETLESEVKKFADSLPYWAKYLAEKILSGKDISEEVINTSYSYLLEELEIKKETPKSDIVVDYNPENKDNYRDDIQLIKVENVEGVNALIENQTIEFNPSLTIIYGANGSGKSGYIRLLKKVFYSKVPEDILHNIHLEKSPKPINASFIFKSDKTNIPLTFSEKNNAEFDQFAVFDGKGLFRQLAERNEFEFRPAGLSFFADYTNAINRVEQKLNMDIAKKTSGNTANDLSDLFEGDSEIKQVIQSLNAQTIIGDLKKFVPYSEEDKTCKTEIQKQYDEFLLASKGKEKEIKSLKNIKRLLEENKTSIKTLNQYFSAEYLNKIKLAINDCLTKESTAKAEGIENFKTEKIEGIGTEEWKNFILAAEAFAKKQKPESSIYPEAGDNCLLCQQPLLENAEKLITNYWIFIKSTAEENAKKSQETLGKIKQIYEKLNFELFPDENTLTIWLNEKYPNELKLLKQKLSEQKKLTQNIISDIKNKKLTERYEIKISVEQFENIETDIDTSINSLKKDEQAKELEKLLKDKTFLKHKERFNIHFVKFETFVKNQVWLKKAKNASFAKRKITETEKALSDRFFNQKYIETFNEECENLNGNFGVEVNHTGSAGRSFKQLKLKGRNPNTILSEGEQKVIAIADFLAEMKLSGVNRGIVFDDPVNSLDETRKSEIAKRLVELSNKKQIIIFTHDLVFVSSLIGYCSDYSISFDCHWIENRNGNPGQIWLNNSPSYEKEYRNSEPAKKHYIESKKDDCSPMHKEFHLKSGFAALRTCYEVLVINDLFKNVVQRFNERVSVDSLSSVYFDSEIIEELQDSFAQCCRYMEGHTHSDKYAYKKPEPVNLNEEIQRYELLRKKIRKTKKPISQ